MDLFHNPMISNMDCISGSSFRSLGIYISKFLILKIPLPLNKVGNSSRRPLKAKSLVSNIMSGRDILDLSSRISFGIAVKEHPLILNCPRFIIRSKFKLSCFKLTLRSDVNKCSTSLILKIYFQSTSGTLNKESCSLSIRNALEFQSYIIEYLLGT